MNLVLVIVAVYSLHISIVALDESNKTAQAQDIANNQQLKALEAARQAILTTSSQQQAILDKSHRALEDQLIASRKQTQTIQQMLNTGEQQQRLLSQQLVTMRAQTAVLEEQWNLANQKPVIAVLTLSMADFPPGYVYINMTPYGMLGAASRLGGFYPDRMSNADSPPEIPFTIRNVGTAVLRKPKVSAYLEPPAHLECILFTKNMPSTPKPCDVPPVDLPDLLPDTAGHDLSYQNYKPRDLDENFFVYFTSPNGSDHVTIHFTVSGENLTAATYSVGVAFKK